MKKKIIFLLLVFLSTSLSSCNEEIIETVEIKETEEIVTYEYKPIYSTYSCKIESSSNRNSYSKINYFYYSNFKLAKETNEELSIDGIYSYNEILYEYDSNGYEALSLLTSFDFDGNIIKKIKTEKSNYDKCGNNELGVAYIYEGTNSIPSKIEKTYYSYKYNLSDQMIEKNVYCDSNNYSEKFKWAYDSYGRLICDESYKGSTSLDNYQLINKNEYEYYKETDSLLERKVYISDGNNLVLDNHIIYTYNDNDEAIKYEYYNSLNHLENYWTKSFEGDITIIDYYEYHDGKYCKIKSRECKEYFTNKSSYGPSKTIDENYYYYDYDGAFIGRDYYQREYYPNNGIMLNEECIKFAYENNVFVSYFSERRKNVTYLGIKKINGDVVDCQSNGIKYLPSGNEIKVNISINYSEHPKYSEWLEENRLSKLVNESESKKILNDYYLIFNREIYNNDIKQIINNGNLDRIYNDSQIIGYTYSSIEEYYKDQEALKILFDKDFISSIVVSQYGYVFEEYVK